MDNHAEVDVAVQAQPAGMVTVTVPVEPPAANAEGAAESVALQAGAPFCVMARVRPAIVREPEREAVSVLAATE